MCHAMLNVAHGKTTQDEAKHDNLDGIDRNRTTLKYVA